jgi:hypothetical protein
VRFTAESRYVRSNDECLLWAKSGHAIRLYGCRKFGFVRLSAAKYNAKRIRAALTVSVTATDLFFDILFDSLRKIWR